MKKTVKILFILALSLILISIFSIGVNAVTDDYSDYNEVESGETPKTTTPTPTTTQTTTPKTTTTTTKKTTESPKPHIQAGVFGGVVVATVIVGAGVAMIVARNRLKKYNY